MRRHMVIVPTPPCHAAVYYVLHVFDSFISCLVLEPTLDRNAYRIVGEVSGGRNMPRQLFARVARDRFCHPLIGVARASRTTRVLAV